MKYEVKFTSQFKRDLKLAKNRGKIGNGQCSGTDGLSCWYAFRTVLKKKIQIT